MTQLSFKAHQHRVLVEIEEIEERSGSIIIAKQTIEKEQQAQTYARVLDIGPTAEVDHDVVKVGARVVIAQWCGVRPPGDAYKRLRIISDTDVCCIVDEEDV
jgi:co-chaperonin GroES (HSP10)